ncbi:heterokaryon incompatibility [Tricladium varicosporioides]|nr:heterokaryon incompatibility [Hymenoscyphus varicosporioides]
MSQRTYRYACLSYVWGGVSCLKTKRHILEGLMLEGSLDIYRDEIPRTIRDAMSLTEQLGIRYIWIDALCIVQDDEVSKHDQIQAMVGIYTNAYVTLIAANG